MIKSDEGAPAAKRARTEAPYSNQEPNGGVENVSKATGAGGAQNGSNGQINSLPSGPPQPAPSSGTDIEDDYDDELEAEAIKTETQCAVCDDGGNLILCDGACMRGFHYGLEGTTCNQLTIPQDLASHLVNITEPFQCPNCLSGIHQCYICKQEGKADTDVFRCMIASCGKYYNLKCLEKERSSEAEASDSKDFICPHHLCKACGEEVDEDQGELVGCRRCPTAYHRGCMPLNLECSKEARVWYADFDAEGQLLPGCEVERSLIYCERHKLDKTTGVATHSRPLFSERLLEKFRLHYARLYPQLESSKEVLEEESSEELSDSEDEYEEALEVQPPGGSSDQQQQRQAGGAGKTGQAVPSDGFGPGIPIKKITTEECLPSVHNLFHQAKMSISKDEVKDRVHRPYPYNAGIKVIEDSRLLMLQRSLEFAKKHFEEGKPSWRTVLDKKNTEAILRHQQELEIRLNPFLHGNRYSSYGRHFSSLRLLRAVVDRLIRFVRSGDRVVDFSCGANEFVPMMRARAVEEGAMLLGRAYDIITAKDDSDFVRKDWFQTRAAQENLGNPDQLIIGLNPPFGMNNCLANRFVAHAAEEFSPRVIALIVPAGTLVPAGYKVVLEDASMCRGEEFYVPGSGHKSWNKVPPVFRIMMRQNCMPNFNFHSDPHEWEQIPLE